MNANSMYCSNCRFISSIVAYPFFAILGVIRDFLKKQIITHDYLGKLTVSASSYGTLRNLSFKVSS